MCYLCFNTQPPEGGWLIAKLTPTNLAQFQHTAARRRLGCNSRYVQRSRIVSTHSRPKAAGSGAKIFNASKFCFNTQPPEGGWSLGRYSGQQPLGFNTQPPEGGWLSKW